MNVLVTGATGFTGGHLARALGARGFTVRTLVRKDSDASRLATAGFEAVVGDLRDPAAVDRAVDGVQQVYHIAAAFRTAGQPDSYYRDINVGGTRHVLDAAKRHAVERVIYCSTIGVHGHVGPRPVDETAPFKPGDIYQKTKLEAEQLASSAFDDGLPGVIFRPGGIYGPGDLRFLKLFKPIARRRFVMLGSGEVHYQLIYIDDLIDAIILCGTNENAVGQIYILTGEPVITLNQFVGYIADAVGVPAPRLRLPLWPVKAAAHLCEAVCKPLRIAPPIYPRRVDFFCKERAFKTEKAKRGLGFAPVVHPSDGLRRTADWYVENGYLNLRRTNRDVLAERT